MQRQLLITLLLEALCSAVQGRFSPPELAATAVNPVWQNFTNEESTFILGIDLLKNTTADTALDCATLCNEDLECVKWTWCPAEEGCSVVPFGAITEVGTLPAGTCLTSHDATDDRDAFLTIKGKSVAWAGGSYVSSSETIEVSPSPAPLSSPELSPPLETSPEPSPGPSPEPSPEPRKGNQCGPDNFLQTGLYEPLDDQYLRYEMDVADDLACCELCLQEPACTFFQYCYPEALSCVSFTDGEGYPIELGWKDVLPGTCTMFSVPQDKIAPENFDVLAEGGETPFASGSPFFLFTSSG